MTNAINRRRDMPARRHGSTSADDWIALAGRIALALIFLWSGYGKLADIQGTVGYMSAHHMPAANVLVWLALILELIGGAMLLVGWRARWAALALAAFTLLAGLIFHNFWAVPPDQALNQTIHFMKNIAIIGGLLQVAAFGPGRYSIDGKQAESRPAPA
ncbi:MAG: DoxX family protein [Rhodospirillaceae bacterium]